MSMRSLISKAVCLVFALGICLMAGMVGSQYTAPSIPTWYAGLEKPDLTPPSWVFGPVWTVLYIMMGLSLYLILQSGIKKGEVAFGLILFIFQLLLNVGWSYVFFGGQSTLFGFVVIIALWAVLLSTIIQVFRFTVAGAALLIPYLIWVSFAAYLNYAIMMMNPISVNLPL
jgi:benzodiazapine receptor